MVDRPVDQSRKGKLVLKIKKAGAVLTAAAMTVGLLLTLAPATAFAGNSAYCSGVWVCVYKNSDFNVGLGYRGAGFSLQNISAANDNEVSSWENRTGTNARWYTDGGGAGTCHNMSRYSELNWMSPFGQNDNMSSWAGNGSC